MNDLIDTVRSITSLGQKASSVLLLYGRDTFGNKTNGENLICTFESI